MHKKKEDLTKTGCALIRNVRSGPSNELEMFFLCFLLRVASSQIPPHLHRNRCHTNLRRHRRRRHPCSHMTVT